MSKQNFKKLSIQELEASTSSSVWVLNQSNPKGNVAMTMPDGMGGTVVVTVPVTWIPVDLTTQATKKSITSSPTFRRMMITGMLAVISDDDASKLLDTAEARKEADRVYRFVSDVSANESVIPQEVKSLQAEVSGNVSGFAMNLATSDIDEEQALNMMRGNETSMTEDDFKYIAANSVHARVKSYAASKLVD